jgi:hypothetical protein
LLALAILLAAGAGAFAAPGLTVSAAQTGGTVTISGSTAASAEVGIQVEDAQGNVVFVGQVLSNGQGAFQDSFTLSSTDLSGTYTVYATADTAAGTVSGSTTLQVQQVQQSVTVTAVESLAGITVPYGTALADAGLPSTVGVTLSDGSTTSVGVTWNGGSPAYNADVAGSYAFTGTLSLPSGVTNPNGLTAAVTVTVEQQAQQSVSVTAVGSLAGITVPYGTALADVGLPSTVGVTLSDGVDSTVGVTWNGGSPAYNGNAAGSYAFTGTLSLPSGVTNPNGLTAAVTVNVQSPSSSGAPVSSGGGGSISVPVSTPVVTGVSPTTGTAGTTVNIIGSGFTGATAVDFGSNAAQSFTVESDSEITAVAPPGTGTVDVTVVTSGGTSATGSADQFTYQPAPCTASFSDVPASYWAYKDILTLACKGIIAGFPDGTFQPDASVTRAQFVTMLVRTLGLKLGTGNTPFTDVAPTAWYAPYVAAAQQDGIVAGISPTEFGPNEPITREEMAVLLAHVLGSSAVPGSPLKFTDTASIASWAQAAVQEVVGAGLMAGFPNGTFQPTGVSTRAQAAAVLAQYLAYSAQK